jgi:hypothetical protein
MPRSLPYAPGDIVAVPPRALGVVARADGKGIALGYFFGQHHDLDPAKAVRVCRFGDRGILTGRWRVVGRVPDFVRAQWPVPVFCRSGEILVHYDDQTLQVVSERRSSPEECRGLPEDGLEGSGFVEIKLTRLLAS